MALLRTLRPTLKKVLQDEEDQDRVQGCTDMNLNPGLVRYVAPGQVFLTKAQFPYLHNGMVTTTPSRTVMEGKILTW